MSHAQRTSWLNSSWHCCGQAKRYLELRQVEVELPLWAIGPVLIMDAGASSAESWTSVSLRAFPRAGQMENPDCRLERNHAKNLSGKGRDALNIYRSLRCLCVFLLFLFSRSRGQLPLDAWTDEARMASCKKTLLSFCFSLSPL